MGSRGGLVVNALPEEGPALDVPAQAADRRVRWREPAATRKVNVVERRPITVIDNVLPSSVAESAVPPKSRDQRTQDPRTGRLPRPASSRPVRQQNDYADLKRLVVQQGLLDKQLGYYISNTVIRLAFLGASLTFLLTVESFWLQLLNAAFLAFVFTQLGFLGHDAGHRQIFNGAPRNDSVWLGDQPAARHQPQLVGRHAQPASRQSQRPRPRSSYGLACVCIFRGASPEQARALRRFVGYQSFYFVPVLLLEGIGVRTASVQYLLRGEARIGWSRRR